MILAEMKNKLSSELNSEESKSIIEVVTGFDSMGQILNSKKRFQRNKKKKFLKSYINDKMAILYSIYLVNGPLWAMITL